MRVLIDTNVMIDVLQRREPWYKDGQTIFYAIANQRIRGFITAKEVTDLHFFSRRQFKGEANVDEKARQVLTRIFSLFEVIDTMAEDCLHAIGIFNHDYEDAVMIESAVHAEMDCIVTRNPDHFAPSPVPVYSPEAFVRKLSENVK